MQSDTDRYERRGVSSKKEEVHAAISKIDRGLFPTAFCKIIPDILTGSSEHALVVHADGAGTKSVLAYLYWKETGDLSVWKGIAQDAIVMNTDDLLCVGATESMVFSSVIGRNKHYIPGEVIAALIEGTEEFLALLRTHGMDIQSAGGETADLGDSIRTLVADSTVCARILRDRVIDAGNIRPNDVIVGVASFGQAVYETCHNSGIGSNGLTSARHDVLSSYYRDRYPESFEPAIPPDLVYTGNCLFGDVYEKFSVSDLLLAPTRTYAPPIRKILTEYKDVIHGIIHCTGGGQTKVLHFIRNLHIIKNHLFPPPPVFRLIREQSGTSLREMYQVFNMGHRLELYMPEPYAQGVIDIFNAFGIDAQIIGRTETYEGKKLSIYTEDGVIEYT